MNKNFLLLSSLLLGLPDASTTWATTQSSNATPNQTNDATNQTNDATKLKEMKEQIRRGITGCVQQLGVLYQELFQLYQCWGSLGHNVLNWTAKNKRDTRGVTDSNNPTIDCLTNTKVGSLKAKDHPLAWGEGSNVSYGKFKDGFYYNAKEAISNTNIVWNVHFTETIRHLASYNHTLNEFIKQMETIQAFVQQHPDRVTILSQPWLQQLNHSLFESITPPLDVNTYTMLYTVRDSNGKQLSDFLCNQNTVSTIEYKAFDALSTIHQIQNRKKIGLAITRWKANIANVLLWQKATMDFSGLMKGLDKFNELDSKLGLDIVFLVPEFVTYFKKISTYIVTAQNNLKVNTKIVKDHIRYFSGALYQCKTNNRGYRYR